MNRLIIIGAGGHGKVIADAAEKTNKYSEIAFIDDSILDTNVLGFTVLGTQKELTKYRKTHEIIVGIGDNKIRANIQNILEEKGFNIATVVHPSSIIGKNVVISQGTVVMAGVVINVDTFIGKGCIVNTSSNIDHDCNIQDYVHISPKVSLAGNVFIDNLTWIGIGTTISNNVDVMSNIVVGAGSTILRNLSKSGVYFGSPAKEVIKK